VARLPQNGEKSSKIVALGAPDYSADTEKGILNNNAGNPLQVREALPLAWNILKPARLPIRQIQAPEHRPPRGFRFLHHRSKRCHEICGGILEEGRLRSEGVPGPAARPKQLRLNSGD
jgi:hypothetical protein